MKSFFYKAFKVVPHPFKSLQRYFGIEKEIEHLKAYFRPYRFSLFLFLGLLSFPLFKPAIQKYSEPTKDRIMRAFSSLNQSQIEASSKLIVQGILNDPEIKREGGLYVERLAKEPVVKESVIKLLELSVKDAGFVKSSKELAKDVGLSLVRDKDLEGSLAALTLRILQKKEVKEETSNLVKWVMLQEETKERLVELFRSGFEDERLRSALTNALSGSFYEIMNQQETVEKLRMFSYFLMESDPEESENVRNMIDSIVDKIVNKKREDSRRSELDRILDSSAEESREKTHKKEKVY